MITEFFDRLDPKAHDRFQGWRRKHESGFFFNCKTTTVWMLHHSGCAHHGDTEFAAKDWASLTKRRKVCSTNRRELEQHAHKNGVHDIQICRDCYPRAM